MRITKTILIAVAAIGLLCSCERKEISADFAGLDVEFCNKGIFYTEDQLKVTIYSSHQEVRVIDCSLSDQGIELNDATFSRNTVLSISGGHQDFEISKKISAGASVKGEGRCTIELEDVATGYRIKKTLRYYLYMNNAISVSVAATVNGTSLGVYSEDDIEVTFTRNDKSESLGPVYIKDIHCTYAGYNENITRDYIINKDLLLGNTVFLEFDSDGKYKWTLPKDYVDWVLNDFTDDDTNCQLSINLSFELVNSYSKEQVIIAGTRCDIYRDLIATISINSIYSYQETLKITLKSSYKDIIIDYSEWATSHNGRFSKITYKKEEYEYDVTSNATHLAPINENLDDNRMYTFSLFVNGYRFSNYQSDSEMETFFATIKSGQRTTDVSAEYSELKNTNSGTLKEKIIVNDQRYDINKIYTVDAYETLSEENDNIITVEFPGNLYIKLEQLSSSKGRVKWLTSKDEKSASDLLNATFNNPTEIRDVKYLYIVGDNGNDKFPGGAVSFKISNPTSNNDYAILNIYSRYTLAIDIVPTVIPKFPLYNKNNIDYWDRVVKDVSFNLINIKDNDIIEIWKGTQKYDAIDNDDCLINTMAVCCNTSRANRAGKFFMECSQDNGAQKIAGAANYGKNKRKYAIETLISLLCENNSDYTYNLHLTFIDNNNNGVDYLIKHYMENREFPDSYYGVNKKVRDYNNISASCKSTVKNNGSTVDYLLSLFIRWNDRYHLSHGGNSYPSSTALGDEWRTFNFYVGDLKYDSNKCHIKYALQRYYNESSADNKPWWVFSEGGTCSKNDRDYSEKWYYGNNENTYYKGLQKLP